MGYSKRDAKNAYQREWRKQQRQKPEFREKEKQNNIVKNLRLKYGITLEKYNELLVAQSHSCAICEKHETQQKRRLAVDHNHFTGEIRGLLCDYCNHRLVGRHRDSTIIRKMADYLDQGTGIFVPEAQKKGRRRKGRNAE